MTSSYPDPTAAEAAFYHAFRTLDLGAMRAVWLDSAEASCIHPGAGLLHGTEAIIASWASIFDNSQPPSVSPRLVQASADHNLAVHTVAEHISSGSGDSAALVIATNVYTRTPDGWRMLSHHASLPLVERGRDPSPAVH